MSVTQQDVAYAIKYGLPLGVKLEEAKEDGRKCNKGRPKKYTNKEDIALTTSEYNRKYQREYQRERYRNDPVFRAKKQARSLKEFKQVQQAIKEVKAAFE